MTRTADGYRSEIAASIYEMMDGFAPVAAALDAAAPSVKAIGDLLQNPTAVTP